MSIMKIQSKNIIWFFCCLLIFFISAFIALSFKRSDGLLVRDWLFIGAVSLIVSVLTSFTGPRFIELIKAGQQERRKEKEGDLD